MSRRRGGYYKYSAEELEEFNRAYRDALRERNREVLKIVEKGPRHIVRELERLDEIVHGPYIASRQEEVDLGLWEDAAGLALEVAEGPDDIGPFLSCELKRVRDAAFEKLEDINRPDEGTEGGLVELLRGGPDGGFGAGTHHE